MLVTGLQQVFVEEAACLCLTLPLPNPSRRAAESERLVSCRARLGWIAPDP